jgi:hypothetical protein
MKLGNNKNQFFRTQQQYKVHIYLKTLALRKDLRRNTISNS